MINFKRLREVREDSDVTQAEMAAILKIKRDAYAKWETGENIPSLEVVYNFSKHFGYTLDYVLGLTFNRPRVKYNNYDKTLIITNLKTLRDNSGLSQRELANKLKLTHAAIGRYERGESNPSINTIYNYCKFFNISFYDLCCTKIDVSI